MGWIIVGIILLLFFMPFLISLFGTMTFAIVAFVANCVPILLVLMWPGYNLSGAHLPNPSSDAQQDFVSFLFLICWLTALVLSVVGIWRKRRKKKQLMRPIREQERVAFRKNLRGKDYAYFDGQDR